MAMTGETYPKVYLYKRIVQAKMYIDANYAAATDLDNMAGAACFSRFHFLRLFKKTYGYTPHQYLVHVRLEHAMRHLKDNMQVADVCSSVGFESPGSFSALFKKKNGMSPLAYQRIHQRLQEAVTAKPLAYVPGCIARAYGWIR